MNKFAKDIEDKLAFLFDNFKLIPSLVEDDRTSFTFLAQPRVSDTFEKIKNTLTHLKSGLNIENCKNVKNGHQFFIGDNKISLYYIDKKESFNFSYDLSTYGINSILGKILKGFDLKLTQNGLFYEEFLGTENHQSKVGEFLITNDSEKLFSLLKLDYSKFKLGFNTKDELFSFLTTCPYLNQRVFTEPKKEHKLSIYQDFQAYLISNPIIESSKKLTYNEIDDFFEEINFIEGIERLKEKERRKREAVEKFNGRIILDYYPDFDRKKIGTSMGYFKYSFGDVEEFRDFLAENSLEVIMSKFKEVVNF